MPLDELVEAAEDEDLSAVLRRRQARIDGGMTCSSAGYSIEAHAQDFAGDLVEQNVAQDRREEV